MDEINRDLTHLRFQAIEVVFRHSTLTQTSYDSIEDVIFAADAVEDFIRNGVIRGAQPN